MKRNFKILQFGIGALLLAAMAVLIGQHVPETLAVVYSLFGAITGHPIGAGAVLCAAGPLALTEDQVKEFKAVLDDIKGGWARVKDLPAELQEIAKQVQEMRRFKSSGFQPHSPAQTGTVSDGCAEYLGAMIIQIAEKRGNLAENKQRDVLLTRSASILNIQQRTALTSSDIPLPTMYGGEVVALVNQFGDARRYGTVFPLGTGTVKLPRLKTDTAFGLIAASATVTEKSPQTEWVTFASEKFGGLVRMPSEIDQDSIIPMGRFLAEYSARQIASVEDSNFFVGTGAGSGVNGSVKGLTFSTIDNSKATQMASSKTHYSDATLANLRTLRSVPDAAALRTSAYYMHPSFEQLLSSLNSAGDRPYNPNAQLAGASAAQPFVNGPTLDGFPVRWVPIMPAYSTSANVSKVFILFGDLKYQYLGTQGLPRIDTSLEAGFATDEILVRALERFTIGLMATGAVAGLETAAS